MKIFWKSRHGTEFRLETRPHEPFSYERFCILAALAAGAMLLLTALLWEVWR